MIHRSPHADASIPDVDLTSYVLAQAASHPDKRALVDGASGRALTYGELMKGVRATAGGLSERGFGKGDVFALFCPNVIEYAVALHGVSSIGGVVTTINPLYTVDELSRQLQDARARFLLTVPPFLEKAREAAASTGVEEIFVLGEGDGATPFDVLLAHAGDPPEVSFEPAEDVAALPYSSGTTGLQKGVMLTHRNLVANIVQTDRAIQGAVTKDDVAIGLLPFFHIYGLAVILNMALRVGATVVTLPRFELESFLATLSRHRVTVAHLVPPIVLALAKHPAVDDFDLASLRWVMSGAAPLGEDVARSAAERLGCSVVQGYGLTETSPVTHVSAVLPPEEAKLGSVGPLVPSTECRVVSPEAGAELGPGEPGELWIRGPQVMKGYLNDPEATSAAIDADGWFRTGDIGYADEDGSFFIVDRLKELIKYKGMQVAPAELEAVLVSHPAIRDAAVIPKPDEEAGEVPKAFVVMTEDASKEDILAYVAERVAPHKKIRHLEVVERIPKSPSGKILRRLLVERERASERAPFS